MRLEDKTLGPSLFQGRVYFDHFVIIQDANPPQGSRFDVDPRIPQRSLTRRTSNTDFNVAINPSLRLINRFLAYFDHRVNSFLILRRHLTTQLTVEFKNV